MSSTPGAARGRWRRRRAGRAGGGRRAGPGSASAARRWWRRIAGLPPGLRLAVALVAVALVSLAVNGAYQVLRKPTELFFPVSGTLDKTPAETWREYAPIFTEHATADIPAEFLAALAQVEGAGNPVARTYWRFAPGRRPFEIYRPASSAVGMYQITDGTFAEARRYCIHDHVVVADGPWNAPRSCWFNSLYFRVVPSHAVEMTSAWLDVKLREALARYRVRRAGAARKLDVATLIHLCGPGVANAYVRRGFRLRAGERCGAHDPRAYLARVRSMTGVFRRLARE